MGGENNMFIILSIFFFMVVMAAAVFGFGWFYVSFAWLFRILFWVFLFGGIAALVVGLVGRGSENR
jgi:hypothetical protein